MVALMLYRVLVSRQAAHHALHAIGGLPNWQVTQVSSSDLIRDIFGTPFSPMTLNLSWLTATVTGLAETIYQERAFDRMPILADALEYAGCGNKDILSHCRSGGEHVRGCWVIGMLTGRK